jgi:outer membrane autotransporter protein
LNYEFGGFEIEPTASVRYADTRIDGFTELGGVTALSISRAKDQSLRTNVGARIGKSFELMGATLRPSLHGGWYHEFEDRTHLISASFVNSAIPTPFAFTTTALRRNYYNAGGSLEVFGSGPVSMFTGYDAQFDKDRQFYNMTLGVKIAL